MTSRMTTKARFGAYLGAVVLAVVSCGGSDTAGRGQVDESGAATPTEPDASDGSGSGRPDLLMDPGDDGQYEADLDPADFVTNIDNPYLPLSPGKRWVYEDVEDDEDERVEVVVTSDRKQILGISAIVVRDTVTADGELVEDTYDWFAQDREGNVWYLGEESTEYQDGEVVSTAGSWQAGVDGAQAGIVMLADPTVGQVYRQEFYPGEAEDMAEVVRRGASESVAVGEFDHLVVIREWNPLEPDVVEEKYFAPGIGQILGVVVAGGEGREELVDGP
jgi:hypothetical protein